MQSKQQRIEELETLIADIRIRHELDLTDLCEELDHRDRIIDELAEDSRRAIARIDEVTAHRNFLSQTLSAIAYYGGNNPDIPAELASVALREFGVELKREKIDYDPS